MEEDFSDEHFIEGESEDGKRYQIIMMCKS